MFRKSINLTNELISIIPKLIHFIQISLNQVTSNKKLAKIAKIYKEKTPNLRSEINL